MNLGTGEIQSINILMANQQFTQDFAFLNVTTNL